MNYRDRLLARLKSAREYSEGLLAKFETPQDWVYQVHDKANHALWFAGHIGSADGYFISVIDPQKVQEKEGFSDRFGMGSKPTSNIDDYPPRDEVLGYMRERRATLMSCLEGMSDEDLEKKTPEGTPDRFPDYASVFELAIWHEGLHAGQVSIASRGLGRSPVFGGTD